MATLKRVQCTAPSSRLASVRRSVVTAFVLVATLGSAFLWWRTSHIDRNGHIPRPNLGVNVPYFLLQATALKNGLHCVCMSGYPKTRLSAQFERQSHIHEPGYARADNNVSIAGFRFVLLTRRLDNSDSILSPFCAIVFPYWLLVSFFSGVFLCRARLFWCRSLKSYDDPADDSLTALPPESAQGT